MTTLRVLSKMDASFANNSDLSSQLGHIVVLTDDTERANVLTFGIYSLKW